VQRADSSKRTVRTCRGEIRLSRRDLRRYPAAPAATRWRSREQGAATLYALAIVAFVATLLALEFDVIDRRAQADLLGEAQVTAQNLTMQALKVTRDVVDRGLLAPTCRGRRAIFQVKAADATVVRTLMQTFDVKTQRLTLAFCAPRSVTAAARFAHAASATGTACETVHVRVDLDAGTCKSGVLPETPYRAVATLVARPPAAKTLRHVPRADLLPYDYTLPAQIAPRDGASEPPTCHQRCHAYGGRP
jgi:hypothetical protein